MNSLREDQGLQLAPLIDSLLHRTPLVNPLPSKSALSSARNNLHRTLPEAGLGLEKTIEHLTNHVKPGLNGSSLSPNYYGFVSGGSTPAATLADNLVTLYDQNVQVHLPEESIGIDVDDAAMRMLCSLLNLNADDWSHRTFTTGATASNIVGLGCGREYVISKHLATQKSSSAVSVGELGLAKAMREAGLEDVQILTTVPHSSLSKAASVVGLGRSSVKFVNSSDSPHLIDLHKLEELLKTPAIASIVAISCAEVNTGNYATTGFKHMKQIRDLCDLYGAWLHVDGAFGIFARLLDGTSDGFGQAMAEGAAGVELADSITGDCHKLLNVPYDCGFVLSRSRTIAEEVFQNPNATYLTSGALADIASPLNIGLENSRRFRALPVYATLLAYGKEGYVDMVRRQVTLARGIAKFIHESDHFQLLPKNTSGLEGIFMIVLFRATDPELNKQLVQLVKGTLQIYISGTSWNGLPACRFAVANWQVDPERDLKLIQSVLTGIVDKWGQSHS